MFFVFGLFGLFLFCFGLFREKTEKKLHPRKNWSAFSFSGLFCFLATCTRARKIGQPRYATAVAAPPLTRRHDLSGLSPRPYTGHGRAQEVAIAF